MKACLFLAALTFAPSSFAQGFPEATLKRLDNAVDASTVQMMMPGTCQEMKEDKNFKNDVLAAARADDEANARAWKILQDKAVNSAWSVGGSAWFAKVARHSAPSESMVGVYNSIYRLGPYASMGLLAGASVSASIPIATTGKPDAELILNSDRLNSFAGEAAANGAAIFSLNKDEEATLKSAIKAEVVKKVRIKDESPLDFFELMKKASFKGKSILSPGERKVLEEIESVKSGEVESTPQTPAEKFAHLSFMNKFLGVCVSSGRMSPVRISEAKKRISRNEKVINEVRELAANTGEFVPAEEEKSSTLDVE